MNYHPKLDPRKYDPDGRPWQTPPESWQSQTDRFQGQAGSTVSSSRRSFAATPATSEYAFSAAPSSQSGGVPLSGPYGPRQDFDNRTLVPDDSITNVDVGDKDPPSRGQSSAESYLPPHPSAPWPAAAPSRYSGQNTGPGPAPRSYTATQSGVSGSLVQPARTNSQSGRSGAPPPFSSGPTHPQSSMPRTQPMPMYTCQSSQVSAFSAGGLTPAESVASYEQPRGGSALPDINRLRLKDDPNSARYYTGDQKRDQAIIAQLERQEEEDEAAYRAQVMEDQRRGQEDTSDRHHKARSSSTRSSHGGRRSDVSRPRDESHRPRSSRGPEHTRGYGGTDYSSLKPVAEERPGRASGPVETTVVEKIIRTTTTTEARRPAPAPSSRVSSQPQRPRRIVPTGSLHTRPRTPPSEWLGDDKPDDDYPDRKHMGPRRSKR